MFLTTYLKTNPKIYLNINHNIKNIHFGGGSPTFLKEPEFEKLVQNVNKLVPFENCDEVAIEIDPRNVDLPNRISKTALVEEIGKKSEKRLSSKIYIFIQYPKFEIFP